MHKRLLFFMQMNDCLAFPDRIVVGAFGAAFRLAVGQAFAGSFAARRCVVRIVIDHADTAVIYHITVALNIGGFTGFGHVRREIGIFVVLSMIIYIWILCGAIALKRSLNFRHPKPSLLRGRCHKVTDEVENLQSEPFARLSLRFIPHQSPIGASFPSRGSPERCNAPAGEKTQVWCMIFIVTSDN